MNVILEPRNGVRPALLAAVVYEVVFLAEGAYLGFVPPTPSSLPPLLLVGVAFVLAWFLLSSVRVERYAGAEA